MRLMRILNGMALIVLMLAGTGAMYGQREGRERKPFGPAMSADCQHPDPSDEPRVLACMSSLRYDRGLSEGRSVFAGKTASNCYGISVMYGEALIKSDVPREQINNLLPSCETLAKALTDINGNPPYWAGCLNYPGHFDASHMKTCLETFLPAYSPGRSLQTLNGCADATSTYEFALAEATRLDQNGRPKRGLPPNYEKPDCQAVAQMLGKGGQCLNYQPNAAHVATCLGLAANQYTACVPLRAAYEEKLREAYGGVFPPGYVMLTCPELSGLTSAAIDKQEAARRAWLEQQKKIRLGAIHPDPAPASFPIDGSGFVHKLFFRWLGWPFFAALICHGALSIAALFYARKQIITRKWNVSENMIGSVLAGSIIRVQMLAAHAALLALGWWLTRWPWAVGAFLVIPVSRMALLVMHIFGLLRVPRHRVGPVDEANTARAKGAAEGEIDQGLSDAWKVKSE